MESLKLRRGGSPILDRSKWKLNNAWERVYSPAQGNVVRTYKLPSFIYGSPGHLGKLYIPQSGYRATLKVFNNQGYNGNSSNYSYMNIIIGTGNGNPSNYYAYYEYGSVSPQWKVYILKTNDYYDIYFDNISYEGVCYLEVSYSPGCSITLESDYVETTIPSGATLLEGRRSGSQGLQGFQGPQGIKGQDATVTWDKIKALFNANGFTLTNGQLKATCFQATSGFFEG